MRHLDRFYRDLVIIGLSVIITLLLVHIGFLQEALSRAQEQIYIGSFLAGVFFTSIFTVAPASVVLAELSELGSPTGVALWGALGAMCGDLLLFLFIRDIFGDDLRTFLQKHRKLDVVSSLHFGFLRWLYPLFGAFIIASPLPDELGLTMLGLAKVPLRLLLPLVFVFNFLGIYVIGLVAAGI